MFTFLPIFAFAAPLGADSAAVCTALAAQQRIAMRRRLVIAATLTAFEAGTPAIGMSLSGPVGHLLGQAAAYIAGALLIGLGCWMLRPQGESDTHEKLGTAAGLLPLLAVGVAVSIDEIAVGVSFGIAGVALLPLVLTVACWVFTATMTGLTLGSRIGARYRDRAGLVAAFALIVLGVLVAAGVL
jgi:putative Mn2+ efflux pump MntP